MPRTGTGGASGARRTGSDLARRVRRGVAGLANTGRRRGRKWLTGLRVRLTVAGVARVMRICAGGLRRSAQSLVRPQRASGMEDTDRPEVVRPADDVDSGLEQGSWWEGLTCYRVT